MKLQRIIDFLRECHNIKTDIYLQSESTANIISCKLLDSNFRFFSSDFLYVGLVTDFPQKVFTLKGNRDNNHLNFFLIQNESLNTEILQMHSFNIYLLPQESDLQQIHSIICSVLEDESREIEIMNQILNGLYNNKGLQGIIATAADIFENSILVNDISYNILAKYFRTTATRISFEKNIIGSGFIHEDTINEMREFDIFSTIHQSPAAFVAHQKSTKNRWLFQTVKINGASIADIAVIEDNRPFRYIDFILIEFLAKIIAIEMQKDEFFTKNKNQAYGHFIQDLLNGTLNNETIIAQRAKMLDIKFHNNFWITVAKPSHSVENTKNANYITSQLLQFFPDGKWITYQQASIALFSRKYDQSFSKTEYARLHNFAHDNHLSIGISDLFHDSTQIPVYYKQAQHACDTIVPGKPAYGIKIFSEVLIYHIIQIVKNEDLHKELLHPALLKLEEYDQAYNTELMPTLKQYLMCARNVTHTADKLHLHRNTILYRINRIREITELNLESGEEFFKMMLHIKIKEYNAYQK